MAGHCFCPVADGEAFLVIVAASTSCISGEPLADVFDRLVDLEYTNTELVIGEHGVIAPPKIAEHYDSVVQLRRSSRRMVPIAIYFDVEPGSPDYVEQFSLACKLAKDCKIVVITVHASVHGTSFNEEIDRLRELVKIGMSYGVVVGLATEAGRITDTPDTVGSLCKNVKGLGVTLDPSHYIYNFSKPKDYESILPHVCHIRLRDTTPKHFQTRIGQGIVEFGRLVVQLNKVDYRRALCVDLAPLPNVDPLAELRKMRLLLESLL
jgi:sugar phosphate isomerase/epimerase